MQLIGEGGLLTGLTKWMIEAAAEEEIRERTLPMTSTIRLAAMAAVPASAIAPS